MVIVNFDKVFTIEELLNAKKYTFSSLVNGEGSRGVYFFYDKDGALLYIGWAAYLSERIREHITGRSSNTKHFHEEMYELKILYESSFERFRRAYVDCKDIEFYLIEKLNPKYNRAKSKKNAYISNMRRRT